MSTSQHHTTILILAANPLSTARLRLDTEIKQITASLERAKNRDAFNLVSRLAVTRREFQRAILETKPHYVHFCGHGEGEAGIVLEDEHHAAGLMEATALSSLFELFADTVKCVVLNACYSQVQANAIAKHIHYVIGMNRRISDAAATSFSAAFYESLGAGEKIEFAFKYALTAIRLQNLPEHLTPVLLQQDAVLATPALSTSPIPQPDSIPTMSPQKVVIAYKRKLEPDGYLLDCLEQHLTARGHQIFIDRQLPIGVAWAIQIEQELKAADVVIVLLSAESVYSEMLAYEVEIAHQAALHNHGQPRLLPIRVHFDGALPQELAGKLEPLHYFMWHSPKDDAALLAEVQRSIEQRTATLPLQGKKPEMIGGAMPLKSEFYVTRSADAEFYAAIDRLDSIVLLKGPRQVGKTSLLARGLDHARGTDFQVVITDLQKFLEAERQNLEQFLLAVGERFADQLNLAVYPEDLWKFGRSPITNFERYLRREVLNKLEQPLLWAIDEADVLFHYPFSTELFALFRTWHNERALKPDVAWSRLVLSITYATEAHLFIQDLNQSPFNVGTRLSLDDFTLAEVADLNRRYGQPLRERVEVKAFYELVGGQPYMVQRGLTELVNQGLSLADFQATVALDSGIYGDLLKRFLVVLVNNAALRESVLAVWHHKPCCDFDSFYRLRSAGILRGDSRDEAQFRCQVYADYLGKHLL